MFNDIEQKCWKIILGDTAVINLNWFKYVSYYLRMFVSQTLKGESFEHLILQFKCLTFVGQQHRSSSSNSK